MGSDIMAEEGLTEEARQTKRYGFVLYDPDEDTAFAETPLWSSVLPPGVEEAKAPPPSLKKQAVDERAPRPIAMARPEPQPAAAAPSSHAAPPKSSLQALLARKKKELD